MKIQIAKAFRGYKKGQVFDWADGMARIFIAKGFIVPVADEPVERAVADEPEARTATLDPQVKRRKTK